jgi:hypothetical protein
LLSGLDPFGDDRRTLLMAHVHNQAKKSLSKLGRNHRREPSVNLDDVKIQRSESGKRRKGHTKVVKSHPYAEIVKRGNAPG